MHRVTDFHDLHPQQLAPYIDHTLLTPGATQAQVRVLCEQALEFGFASVCVNPCHIALVSKLLQGSVVKSCSVVGFPLGAVTAQMKAAEARAVLALGAQEVDMVANIGAIKSGDWAHVHDDIAAVVHAAGEALVKVIIEACLLSDSEKTTACEAAKRAGAHFVKTSTGFSTGGATLHDVRLMRAAVCGELGVKAAGGIRNYAAVVQMLEAGATRIGTSAGVGIVTDI